MRANVFFDKNKLTNLDVLPLIILDNVKTPENLGSIIRLAGNIGVNEIFLINQHNQFRDSKIKSTATTAFKDIKIIHCDYANIIDKYNDYTFFAVETVNTAKNIYNEILPQKSAFIFGNEAHGISNKVIEKTPNKLYIPIHGKTKSMNIAQAATVVMFEWLRQNFYIK